MMVIGVDPGVASTGYGIIRVEKNVFEYVTHGCVKTSSQHPLADRIFSICSEIEIELMKHHITVIGIEDIFFSKNITSALAVAQVKGSVLFLAKKHGLHVVELHPLAIKQALVGYGSADKAQVQKMTQLVLKLKEIPKPHHAADALAMAICAAQLDNHKS